MVQDHDMHIIHDMQVEKNYELVVFVLYQIPYFQHNVRNMLPFYSYYDVVQVEILHLIFQFLNHLKLLFHFLSILMLSFLIEHADENLLYFYLHL